MPRVLEMNHISKAFPGVLALDDVSLHLEAGEILALLGENGAGKSTLIKILGGAYYADSGEIIVNGQKVESSGPLAMMKYKISVMHQELSYLNDLTIAENIFLGRLPCNRFGLVQYDKLYQDSRELLKMVGLDRSPKAMMSELKVAEKQLVEVAKALSNEVNILVMDEPTSALNELEVQNLFGILRRLVAQGKSVIYISHKMDEIFTISDRVQVLRDGKDIGVRKTSETTPDELVAMMVGRKIDNIYPKTVIEPGEAVLEVENLCADHVDNVSFTVRKGEVVGLFGLMGAGRTEIVETIFGKNRRYNGQVKVNGQALKIDTPRDAINAGIAYIPRERKDDGLVMTETVKNNMTLVYLDKLMKCGKLDLKEERSIVDDWVKRLKVKTPSTATLIESLSGGNQQKVIVGKWMMMNPKVIILNEPTRGIDVAAKREIYYLINELCMEGMAVLIISSETPEIMGISDRIIVVHEGKITGECARGAFDQEKIMCYAIGEDTL